MLDDIEGSLVTASKLTDHLVDVASDRAELFRSMGNTRNQVVQRKVQQARTRAGGLLVSSAQQSGAENEGMGSCSRNDRLLFERRPFPHFDGLKQNFPSFWREWSETVTKAKFPP